MTIPRTWHPPPVEEKKTALLDWWVFRLASTSIASIFSFKTADSKDTSDSEVEIEMDEIALDDDDHDKCENLAGSRRSQRDAESDFQRGTAATEDSNGQCTHNPARYSSLKRAMGLRAPR